MEGLLGCGRNPEWLKRKRTDAGESPGGTQTMELASRGARRFSRLLRLKKKRFAGKEGDSSNGDVNSNSDVKRTERNKDANNGR